LFIMAVAPALPWRKATGDLLGRRLVWPAWGATLTVAACVALGVRGLAPLAAFGLGAFAAGAAVRQLALSTRRQGLRGLLGRAIGTPSVRSGPVDDVYLTVAAPPTTPHGPAVIGVTVQPLIAWLWIGGGLMGFGTLLAAVPGRRRRPTDPASAPVPEEGRAA